MTQHPLPGMEVHQLGDGREHHPTPPRLCDALCAAYEQAFGEPRTVLEPSAGCGNFVRAARRRWPKAFILAVDVVDTRVECRAVGADAFHLGDWVKFAREGRNGANQLRGLRVDLVLGNPPASLAAPHVEAALSFLPPFGRVAFLLRSTFEEWTEARTDFWRRCPLSARAAIAQRPSFDGAGTDGALWEFLVWQRYVGVEPKGLLLPPVVWK